MKVEERAIPGSTDVMFNIIFEEEDMDLYDSFVKIAEAEGKTAQEVVDELFSSDNFLKFCSSNESGGQA